MSTDPRPNFPVVVSDVARLLGRAFDRQAREQLNLSRAQVRLLAVIDRDPSGTLTQAALAKQMDMTPMAVAALCGRMETADWIKRKTSPTDRRAYVLTLTPQAHAVLAAAIHISDALQDEVLAGLDKEEKDLLLRWLLSVRQKLVTRAAWRASR